MHGGVMSNLAHLLFPPSVPAFAPDPQTRPSGARKEIGDMIEALRAHLDMDVAFVSRQIGTTHRIFTHVAARGVAPLATGDQNANDNSLCWLVIQGKLPERVTDTSHYEVASCLPIVDAINVRSHFSVPLRRRDGRVHGSLCCFSYRPRPDIEERDMQMLRSVAAIVSDQIESRIELEERCEDAAQEIARLIWDDDLTIIHQPIYDLTDWHLIGHECLMRHHADPERSPRELLERAHAAGKTMELELHVARKALETLDPAHPERFIAINVSPATLVSEALSALIPEGLEARLVIELNQQESAPQQAMVKDAIEAWKTRAWVAVNSQGRASRGCSRWSISGPTSSRSTASSSAGWAPIRRAGRWSRRWCSSLRRPGSRLSRKGWRPARICRPCASWACASRKATSSESPSSRSAARRCADPAASDLAVPARRGVIWPLDRLPNGRLERAGAERLVDHDGIGKPLPDQRAASGDEHDGNRPRGADRRDGIDAGAPNDQIVCEDQVGTPPLGSRDSLLHARSDIDGDVTQRLDGIPQLDGNEKFVFDDKGMGHCDLENGGRAQCLSAADALETGQRYSQYGRR